MTGCAPCSAGAGGSTVTHQVAVTIVLPIVSGQEAALRAALEPLHDDPAGNEVLPFGKLDGVHFARMVVFDPDAGLDGQPIPGQLLFLLDCDAPGGRRLRDAVRLAGERLDSLLQYCSGYPASGLRDNRARYGYLRRHVIATDVSYVNTVGRPLAQIRQEAMLHEALQDFLDQPGHNWGAKTPTRVRSDIRDFVESRPDLAWALRPAATPGLRWRVGDWAHLGRSLLLILALAPVAILAAPLFAVLLRWHERRDPAPRLIPTDEHARRLADDEDHCAQNQFTAIGHLKPGRFRELTAVVVLWLVGLGVRHIYNNGVLTGVRTIHAARWVFIDNRRRLVFASNYDGSLESYMDDFINKVSWGLNAVFSNGLEYPRTNWLVRDGAEDELAFKGYIRTRQVPTEVWYTAYPHLTAVNIANNAHIRAGLHGEMDEDAAAAWLRLL